MSTWNILVSKNCLLICKQLSYNGLSVPNSNLYRTLLIRDKNSLIVYDGIVFGSKCTYFKNSHIKKSCTFPGRVPLYIEIKFDKRCCYFSVIISLTLLVFMRTLKNTRVYSDTIHLRKSSLNNNLTSWYYFAWIYSLYE